MINKHLKTFDEHSKNEKIDLSDVSCNLSKDEQKEMCFKLRKETGCGMMDCKYALQETNWDIKKAKIYLEEFLRQPRIMC